MPQFSSTSQEKLDSAHQDLITLFHYVVQGFDCSILHGHRSPDLQFQLFQIGRKLDNGIWIIHDKRKVVTYKDGKEKLSKHNEFPSSAIDATPYPINWKDEETIRYFAGYVKGWAAALKSYNAISHDIVWGGDWDDDNDLHDQSFMDLFHFQLK